MYYRQKLTLAAEMLSVQQMIANFTNGLSGLTFIDPEVSQFLLIGSVRTEG